MEHHKNTLIGGRAGTMAGAYTAISDDASGAFYNPAGLAFATSSSFSGSANTYSNSKSVYEGAIGGEDWNREASSLRPNFFGVVQKSGRHTFAFSYALIDPFEEHQDQIFTNLTDVVDPIDLYVLNIHSQDNTYLIGPSYSRKITQNVSWGASLFYHYRVFRRAQSQLIRYSDGDDESSYLNNIKKEKGLRPKIGLMVNTTDKWSFGASLAKTQIITSLTDTQLNEKDKGDSTFGFSQVENTDKRKTPIELQTGAAYFHSAYLLCSANIDYFKASDKEREDVINASVGAEYYLSEKHAVRGGLFTNRTNSKEPSGSTAAPTEHIDLYGITAGYALYSKDTSVTFGTIYSMGSGKAQIFDGSVATIDFKKRSLDFIISADYGF